MQCTHGFLCFVLFVQVLRFYGVVTESAADNTVIGIMTEYIRGGSMSSFLR